MGGCPAAAAVAVECSECRTGECGPRHCTDRPLVANSSEVVPQGGLQLENGLLATSPGNGAAVELPETNIRCGLLPRTEP
jgi:hypothetical protein